MALENAEEGRLPVVCAEAPKESGVDEEVLPMLADGGGTREGGRLWREAEEDLREQGGRCRSNGSLLAGVPRRGASFY